jgi:hypothetical protein
MIKFNSYPEERVLVFNPDGSLLGYANLNELYDIRCQIAENRLTGYYVQYNGNKTEINKCGMIQISSIDMPSTLTNLCGRLLRAQKFHFNS